MGRGRADDEAAPKLFSFLQRRRLDAALLLLLSKGAFVSVALCTDVCQPSQALSFHPLFFFIGGPTDWLASIVAADAWAQEKERKKEIIIRCAAAAAVQVGTQVSSCAAAAAWCCSTPTHTHSSSDIRRTSRLVAGLVASQRYYDINKKEEGSRRRLILFAIASSSISLLYKLLYTFILCLSLSLFGRVVPPRTNQLLICRRIYL